MLKSELTVTSLEPDSKGLFTIHAESTPDPDSGEYMSAQIHTKDPDLIKTYQQGQPLNLSLTAPSRSSQSSQSVSSPEKSTDASSPTKSDGTAKS